MSVKVVELIEEGDIRGCGGGVVVCDGLEALPHTLGLGVGEVFFYLPFDRVVRLSYNHLNCYYSA